jgi:nucleotide-binding universal stress UspA family protein
VIRIRSIVYPTDFSSYSTQAYFHAVGLAERYGATLTVVFVYNAAVDEANRGQEYWAEQLRQVVPLNPKVTVRHAMLAGDPATEIVRHAAAEHADVIVIGTHGRTGVDRLVFGSVAERVMREAPCSVLVVKLPKGGRGSGVFQPVAVKPAG